MMMSVLELMPTLAMAGYSQQKPAGTGVNGSNVFMFEILKISNQLHVVYMNVVSHSKVNGEFF